MLDQVVEFFSFDIKEYSFILSCNFVNSKASAHVFSAPKRAHRDQRAGVESVVHGQRINCSCTTRPLQLQEVKSFCTPDCEWLLSVAGSVGVDANGPKPRK